MRHAERGGGGPVRAPDEAQDLSRWMAQARALAHEEAALLQAGQRGQRITMLALVLACIGAAVLWLHDRHTRAVDAETATHLRGVIDGHLARFEACALPGAGGGHDDADLERTLREFGARYGLYYAERLSTCRAELQQLAAEMAPEALSEGLQGPASAVRGAAERLDGAWETYGTFLAGDDHGGQARSETPEARRITHEIGEATRALERARAGVTHIAAHGG